MARSLTERLEDWVRLPRGADAVSEEHALADQVRSLAFGSAKACDLSDQDADDVAQKTFGKLVRYLGKGNTIRDTAEKLVWRIAQNLALDLYRARKRERDGKERLKRVELAAEPTADPEALWLSLEHQEWVQSHVRAALEGAPATYRKVLERHYIDGQPIEEIAEDYFREMVAAGAVDVGDQAATTAARRQARNRADQHLKRGRDWLRKRISEQLGEAT